MRNKRSFFSYMLPALLLLSVAIYGCKKEDETFAPEEKAFFNKPASDNYRITAPNVTYKIPVGLTAVPGDKNSSVNISVSSPSGAVQGTHYTLNTSTINFANGNVIDTLVVTANYNQYTGGRKDTLVFTFSDSENTSPSLRNTFTLYVSGPCFEGDIVLSELLGDYKNTYDPGYGPYTTTITKAVSTGATTGLITVRNIYDWGWGDLEFTLDWTNAASPKVTFVPQSTGFDAGNLNGSVAGHTAWIYPPSNGDAGSYSYCNQSITINYRICMPTYGGACFSGTNTTTMDR